MPGSIPNGTIVQGEVWTSAQWNTAWQSKTDYAYTAPFTGAVATDVPTKLAQTVSVFDFLTAAQIADVTAGALTLDCSAGIQAAFNSGASVVQIPPYKYKLSSGVQFNGISVVGLGFQPSNPPTGAQFIFDLPVLNCVTMGGPTATNQSATLKGLSILRAAGTPPANSIGLLNQRTYSSIIEDVISISHQVCFNFLDDKTVYGITCMANRIYTCAAYDAHVVIDTFPEVRVNQSRFGMDGSGDQNCNAYVRIQGGSTTNAANGPNTVYFSNCQFNQGVNTGTNWVAFQNQTAAAISDIELFVFANCYVEDDVVGIFTDNTWPSLINVQLDTVVFNPPLSTRQFLGLNAATAINNWMISNCNLKCSFTYNGTPQINFLNITGTQFNGAVSLTGVSNSTAFLTGNKYGNGLTVAGSWASFNAIGGAVTAGSLTTSGITAGNIKIDLGPNNGVQITTPTLTLGGTNVGMSSTGHLAWQVFGNLVTGQFDITLTAKGNSTGAAQLVLTGAPALSGAAYNQGGGGMINYSSGFAALSAAPVMLSIGTGPVLNLYQQTATGINAVTDGNVTAATSFRGTFQYFM